MPDGTQATTTTDATTEAKAAYSAALKAKAPQRELARLAIAVARSTDRLAVRRHWTDLAERHAAYVVEAPPAAPSAAPVVVDDTTAKRLAESEETRSALALEVKRLMAALTASEAQRSAAERSAADAAKGAPPAPAVDRSSGVVRTVVPAVFPGNGDPASGRVTVRALKALAVAMSSDETRYNLNGVLIGGGDVGGRRVVVLVATDGHRLHSVVLPDLGPDCGPTWVGGPVILPAAAVKAACRFKARVPAAQWCGETIVAVKESHADDTVTVAPDEIGSGGSSFECRRIDAQFPDYTQVIPKARVDVDPVAVALNGKYAAEAFTAGMRWCADGKLGCVQVVGAVDKLSPCVLQARNADLGEFVAVIMQMRM